MKGVRIPQQALISKQPDATIEAQVTPARQVFLVYPQPPSTDEAVECRIEHGDGPDLEHRWNK